MRPVYARGMTRKISISVPDDVAETLDGVDNASAYIAEAVRMRRDRETTRELMRRHGYEVSDTGVARWRRRLSELERQADVEA